MHFSSQIPKFSSFIKVSEAVTQEMVNSAAEKAGYSIGPVYHGSPVAGFNTFDVGEIAKHDTDTNVKGFFFSTSREGAEGFAKFPPRRPNTPDGQDETRSFFLFPSMVITRGQAEFIIASGDQLSPGTVVEFTEGYDLTPEYIEEYNANKEVKIGPWTIKEDGEDDVGLYSDSIGHITGSDTLESTFGLIDAGVFVATDPATIKLSDLVTYDDSGLPIPLSERFNLSNPDIRY